MLVIHLTVSVFVYRANDLTEPQYFVNSVIIHIYTLIKYLWNIQM